MKLNHLNAVIPIESYQQTYAYDTGNNLTCLSHQVNSNIWQQTIILNSNSNRGTETQPSATDFDANGNLSTLNNIGTLEWHYNNTLNTLTKPDKTTEYYVYDYQGNRVRTVLEFKQTIQSQRNYLPSLDISTNENKQPTNTLHIGTHILSEITKNNAQTRYQLANHLQSNTLELNDKANIISYEHYYPYGGTALIAGKDQTQVRQKRYRYTSKERDDSSGLSYYGARYLAPWMARWISPDSAGTAAGLNLYVYVGNNPLKYTDPTGHIPTISWDEFVGKINKHMQTNELYVWIGESHSKADGKNLLLNLSNDTHKKFQNILLEGTDAEPDSRPMPASKSLLRKIYARQTTLKVSKKTINSMHAICALIGDGADDYKGYFVGSNDWGDTTIEHQRLKKTQSLTGSSLALVGASHVLTNQLDPNFLDHQTAYPIQQYVEPGISITLTPQTVINLEGKYLNKMRAETKKPEYGFWVSGKDPAVDNAFLVTGKKSVIKRLFGRMAKPIPANLDMITQHPHRQPHGCTIL
ncbi:MAG: RHS repeat-associated core domain-containing protein [Gammaproteobacteria bacterium]|nr:RHS repeat-associated core domain-containing protein [Gammaproteobacteria bacterium]